MLDKKKNHCISKIPSHGRLDFADLPATFGCPNQNVVLHPSSIIHLPPPPVAGVSEQAGRLSSGSLRAHAELLEQRLQAPPILSPHPLLPDRGCHEHGVEAEEQRERRGFGECLGFSQKKKYFFCLLAYLPGRGDMGGARGVANPGLRPLVRSDKPL